LPRAGLRRTSKVTEDMRLKVIAHAALIAPCLLLSACTTPSVWKEYQELNECAGMRYFIDHYPRDPGVPAAKAEVARCGDLRKSDGVSFRHKRISEDVHEYNYGITFRESMGTGVTLHYARAWTLPTQGTCNLGSKEIAAVEIPAKGEVRYTGTIRTERDKPWCMEGTFEAPLVISFTGEDANGHEVELRIHMGTGEVGGF
jgi:hypothetical protein